MRRIILSSIVLWLAGSVPAAVGQTVKQPAPAAPVAVTPLPAGGVVVDHGTAPDGECCFPHPEPCGPDGRFWVSAEYLLWWIKDGHVPPLLTAGTPQSAGILGRPGTQVLFGGNGIDQDAFSGGRFTAGLWLDCDRTVGIEGSYFFLASRSADFAAAGSAAPGSQVLARPFFNPVTGAQDSQLVSFPGLVSGAFTASLRSDLQGAELNGLCNVCCGCNSRLDLLGGFRFLDLGESLDIGESLAVVPTAPLIGGTAFNLFDRFETRNRFYGGQVGARAELRRGPLFMNMTAKVALGATDEVVRIDGATVITSRGGATTAMPGGLLALPTNIGRFSQSRFAVVPEVGVNVGYQLAEKVRVFAGYTFLYWSDVVRPGNQIDPVVNPTQLPLTRPAGGLIGAARPTPFLERTDFWAQGVNFGVEFRF